MTGKEVLVNELQKIARCAPDIARKAVDISFDDPFYLKRDHKDWVAASLRLGPDFSKEKLVHRLEQLTGCGPKTAGRAVDVFIDDPMYIKLDEKIAVMMDWVTAYSFREPDFSKETLVHELQRSSGCGAETARKAVDLFADDEMYGNLDEKIAVMSDWVTAYNVSAALNDEGTSSQHGHSPGHSEQDENEDVSKRELQYDDFHNRWVTDEEEIERQRFESQQEDINLDFIDDGWSDHEPEEEASPPKKQKLDRMHLFGRGPMTGYGVPGSRPIHRHLDESISGPPYFYFENVYSMPSGEWNSISRHFSAVEPEFTDSKHFTACSRPRGYIHNLPTKGRHEISPRAPKTIKELIPEDHEFWPDWDRRISLNCIITQRATESVQREVEELLEGWVDKSKAPPVYVQTQVLRLARKSNLVWVKPGILVPLTVPNIEQVMGYDKDHTRALYHPNDRLKRLGNSFQVHTVGYHFSVLKKLYSTGMKVLSLFAGIGGAEVALQKLGIRLNVVVSVENDERSRRVLDRWWKATNQSGKLILQYTDVRALDRRTLGELVTQFGGFDLIVGGSPCQNLSGLNRFSRTGLAGEKSMLFYEFPRILHNVREFMGMMDKKKKGVQL
ncbi:unnamed protein product [Calypogeia fissa]